jgi:group I intron endonuclease
MNVLNKRIDLRFEFMAFIYKTTNIKNGKIYIGKSKFNNPKYLGSGLKISYAIKKYGVNFFSKEILEECAEHDVNSREEYWIAFYNSRDDSVGYNISKGGDGGAHYWATLTDEERIAHNKKISESKIGKTHAPHTTNTREKQSESFWKYVNDNPTFISDRALKKCKKYICIDHGLNKLYRTSNLKEFCKDHELSVQAMQHYSRTRKNFYKNRWSCVFDTFVDMTECAIIKAVIDECVKNNQEYRTKIGISRKQYNGTMRNKNS